MFAITARLLLRPGWAEDAPALAAAIGDEAVARNLSRVPFPYTESDAATFLALAHPPLRPCFLIFLRGDARLVGGIGLHGEAEPELGYWVARPYWGRGVATEAGQALCALADESLRLPRLRARHAADNPASARVLRKLGFDPAGGGTVHGVGRGQPIETVHVVRHRDHASRPALAA